ncbi:hypothetical protein PMAYCL1PPCAC_00816, partial [Pristionchus mayeri]
DWVLCSGQCYCQFYFDSVFPFHRSLESYCAQFGQIVEGSIGGGEANSQFHALDHLFSIFSIIDLLLQIHLKDSRSIVLLLHEFVHSVIEMSGDLRCVVQISAFFVGSEKVEDTIKSRPRE